jgi:hypothetical protein
MLRLVTFALALSGLCLSSAVRADDAEDKAVAFVKKLGGTVTRDEKAPGEPVITAKVRKVSDAGLKELAALKNLTTLDLWRTSVSDAGLKELAALESLNTLHLGGTKVTDAGMTALTALKNLNSLDLSKTEVTDAGLRELQRALPKCQIKK